MRLLIATGLYPPDIGGPATHTVFLEKHAHELGLELVVVPFGRVRKYPLIIRHIAYLFLLIQRSRGCAYLYALDTISVGVPARIASLLTRKPLILRVPGDYAWEQGRQRFGVTETLDEFRVHRNHPRSVRTLQWLQEWVARGARHVVTPSEYMKDVVKGWGVPEKRITRIYSALKTLTPLGESLPFSPLTDTFVVSTAARLVPWKGIHVLIDVIAELNREGIKMHLHIFGDGTSRDELMKHRGEVGAESQVTFHGAVSRDELAVGIGKSHAFVLNTSYEGLSHQLIEVMSLRVPIITTPVGGNVELIEHEKSGLFMSYNDSRALKDALVRLRQDPELRKSLAQKGEEQLSHFGEETIVGEFRAFFLYASSSLQV